MQYLKAMSLTDKQRAFIDEYLVNGFNGTQAYLKVYPDSDLKSAEASASRLLSNVKVEEALKEARKEIKEMSRMSKAEKLEIAEEIMTDKAGERTLDRLKAMEIHNKMTGDNEPDKVEHSGEGFNLNVIKPEE